MYNCTVHAIKENYLEIFKISKHQTVMPKNWATKPTNFSITVHMWKNQLVSSHMMKDSYKHTVAPCLVLQAQTLSEVLQHFFQPLAKSANTITFIFVENRVRMLKAGFLWFLWMNKSTTEHDTMKLITSFHSELTAHSTCACLQIQCDWIWRRAMPLILI